MNDLAMLRLPVLVLYALAEQQVGMPARRFIAGFTPRRGVHLVAP